MSLPTPKDLHVDANLTNVSIAYKNAAYIADQVFPIVAVRKQSDIVPSFSQSYWFRNEAKLRAPGTKAAEGGYAVSTSDTYYCHPYSFAQVIPDEARDNADAPFDLDREAVEYVSDKILMKREASFAADFFTTSIWNGGTDYTGGTDFTAWSTFSGSSPIVNVDNYKDTMEGKIGREPNKFVIGKEVFTQLKNHPDVVDLIKYTQRAVVGVDLLSSLLGLEVLVGRAIYTTTKEGTAEASVSYSRLWGKHGLLLYVPPAPSLMAPAAGYTFVWQRVPNAGMYIERFRRDEEHSDVIVANANFDQKLTAANAGIFLSSAVA